MLPTVAESSSQKHTRRAQVSWDSSREIHAGKPSPVYPWLPSVRRILPLRGYCVLPFLAYAVIRSSFWAFRFRSRLPISPVHAEVSSFAPLNCCCPAERYPPQFQPTLQATNFKGSFLIYWVRSGRPDWGVNCPRPPKTVGLNPTQDTGVNVCLFFLCCPICG
jgi:hypothetical protein